MSQLLSETAAYAKATRPLMTKRASPQAFYAGRGETMYKLADRGDGCYFWDRDGQRYFDGSSGAVCASLGHGNAHVRQAMIDQIDKITYVIRTAFASEASDKLVNQIVDLAGPGFDQAFLVSGGSEGIEAAIKLARQYKVTVGEDTRHKILARLPSYHGATLGAAAITGDPERDAVFGPIMTVAPKVAAPFSYRIPNGHSVESYAAWCADQLEAQIVAEGKDSVLAFIMEPVGGVATGALVAPDFYYRQVREICDRYGALLIFDEVMSGTGRCGRFLAAHHWPDNLPDIVVIAKGLGAGFSPLGAVLAPDWIVDAVVGSGGFLHGHTYSGNPLSSAAGAAVLDELIRLDLMANADRMGALLRDELRTLADRTQIIGDVRGVGLLNAIEIVSDKPAKTPFPGAYQASYRLSELGRQNGLQIYARRAAGGQYGEWLMASPPLIVTENQVHELVDLIETMIKAYEAELP